MEKIIKVVTNDSYTDAIKRLATLNQSASTCVRKNTKTIGAFIERFSFSAQAYLNYTSTDKPSVACQNLAMTLISKANLPQKLFSTVMLNLELSRKKASNENHPTFFIDLARSQNLTSTLSSLAGGESSEGLQDKINECLTCMKTAPRQLNEHSSETFHEFNIFLPDAISVLEEICYKKNEISR